ncbi:hypothetical protein Gotur_029402 [Gossypium turneri]
MVLCQKIGPLVRYYRWECFCTIPKDFAMVPILQEFYASLQDEESRKVDGRTWETILVYKYGQHYKLPNRGAGEWKCHPGTDIPTFFNQAIMFPKAKMQIQFLCTSIALALNVSNVNTFQARVGVFFPHLVTTICKRAGVSMACMEQSMKPSQSIIGDMLYTQYIKLRAKQIKEWNKSQQEMMAASASSQRKEKSTTQHEIEQEGEEQKSEEEEGTKEGEEDDEMDFEEDD